MPALRGTGRKQRCPQGERGEGWRAVIIMAGKGEGTGGAGSKENGTSTTPKKTQGPGNDQQAGSTLMPVNSAAKSPELLPRSLVEACEKRSTIKAKALHDIVQRSLASTSGSENGEQSGAEGKVLLEDGAWALLSQVAEHLCLSTLQFAVKLVDHRGGSTVEAKDVTRYLRTNMGLDVHGQGVEDQQPTGALKRKARSLPHRERQQEAKRLNQEQQQQQQ